MLALPVLGFIFFLALDSPGYAWPSRPATFDSINAHSNSSISPMTTCVAGILAPDLLDCLLLESSQRREMDYEATYIFGAQGNYTDTYAWSYRNCGFQLVMNAEERWQATIQEIFSIAFHVGSICGRHDPPVGGSILLHPELAGSARIYARRPPIPLPPGTIVAPLPHNVTDNVSNPVIKSKTCVANSRGPKINDCYALFVAESHKTDTWLVQTFGSRGTYTGPYRWTYGRCEYELDMDEVGLLPTTLAWIFQAASDVVTECMRLIPPEGGYAALDHPHRGVHITVRDPLAPGAQQKRALTPDHPLPHLLATPSILATPSNLTYPSPSKNLNVLPPPQPPHCLSSAPSITDCVNLSANILHIPSFSTPRTFGPRGSYIWRYGLCEFRLEMAGSCSWEVSVEEVFGIADMVWVECLQREPEKGGYVRFKVCDGATTVVVWVIR